MTYNGFVILFALTLSATLMICCIIKTIIARRKHPLSYDADTAGCDVIITFAIGLFFFAVILIAPFAKSLSEVVEYKARPDYLYSTKEYDLVSMYKEFDSQPDLYDCVKYELECNDYYKYNGAVSHVDSITIYKQLFTNKLRVVYFHYIPSEKAEQQRIQYENMQEIRDSNEFKEETENED